MLGSVLVMVGMVGLTLAEVAARNLFGTSTFVMNELVGYGVATMTALALGHSLEHGSLIRMNLMLTMFRPQSVLRRAFEILAVLMALVATGIALRYFLRGMLRNYERGYVSETPAQIPLWLPEAFFAAGLAFFILQLLSYLLQLIAGQSFIEGEGEGASAVRDTEI